MGNVISFFIIVWEHDYLYSSFEPYEKFRTTDETEARDYFRKVELTKEKPKAFLFRVDGSITEVIDVKEVA